MGWLRVQPWRWNTSFWEEQNKTWQGTDVWQKGKKKDRASKTMNALVCRHL